VRQPSTASIGGSDGDSTYQHPVEQEGKVDEEKALKLTCGRLIGILSRVARTIADQSHMALKSKSSKHALVISELLLHIKDVDDQLLQQFQKAAERWNSGVSAVEYWLYILEHK